MRSALPTPSYCATVNVLDIDTDGAGVVEDEVAERIVDDAAGPTGAQSEAGEGVGDVVFAAADPDFEGVGEFDAAVAGG